MKAQEQFLQQLIGLIEAAGIPYVVCGSIASGFHGQARATNDADIIISPSRAQIETLLKSLQASYYVSNEASLEAFKNRSMFNAIDNERGWKADLIFRKDSPYALSSFNRRQKARVLGVELCVLSPEDVILSKLDWAKESESELQYRDALGVAVVQWNDLDREYLRHWAQELGIEKTLEELLEKAKRLRGGK